MSEKCIINTEWNYLKNSNVVPFLDGDGSFGGCSFIMAHGPGKMSNVNLVESSKRNNLMNYSSEVLYVGFKRFELSPTDPEEYLLVISAKLRQD